jgi:acetyl-CoA carboxylase biotin carboxylase subunit
VSKRIQKVLVANRGEIAIRVMRTCREMGIATVAVFSDADADMPFVAYADEAVRIGPAAAAESYLVIAKLLAAAKATGADAIHPGYGFLAENAGFAQACADAGVVFIGPPAEAIRVLGSKSESKRLVGRAGVPVVPGYHGAEQSTVTLVDEARRIEYPLLIKASAGGGGKGMRIVREEGELAAAIESARREAKSAFGDDTLLIERYIERPRHVEIQILGDEHGNLLHLFERECSIQRRHQKIIEESPSPAVDEALRARMGAAAVAVGKAVGYTSAGTVEFILAPDGAFYFLEVNTRLQVEHPVTEGVVRRRDGAPGQAQTIDLVREQLRVAQGEALGFAQDDLSLEGAAIECRLCAEDPDNGYLPASGRLLDWHVPALPGLRVDSGVTAGTVVGIHYDSMLAKVIVHAPSRAEAVQRMRAALGGMSVAGVTTNRELLLRVLGHPAFGEGRLDTHFLEHHAESLAPPPVDAPTRRDAVIAATLSAHEARRDARGVLPAVPAGWRSNRIVDEAVDFRLGDASAPIAVRYHHRGGGRFRFSVDGEIAAATVVSWSRDDHAATLVVEDGSGHRRRFRVVAAPDPHAPGGARHHVLGAAGAFVFVELPRFPDTAHAAVEGALVAPMPGKVVKLLVAVGQEVAAGAVLMVLEAMKMEHTVRAVAPGVVAELRVDEGDQVDGEQVLAVVTPVAVHS